MSENKKYFYLKLKESFFDCEDLKIIEGMENGFIYSNLYMKMILLSLKDEGRLLFKGRIPYNEKMLATITGIPIDNVRCGIKILADYGMIEILESGVMYMTDIQDLIGTGSTEAERKARYRKRINEEKEIVPYKNKKRTEKGQCPGQNPPEIEIETKTKIDKDIEKEKEKDPAKRRDPFLSEKNQKYIPLSELLFNEDQKTNPIQYTKQAKAKKVNSWANDIRLLGESIKDQDKAIEIIRNVILWCKNPDNFPGSFSWVPNIRSGKKLRDKFPVLYPQYLKWAIEEKKRQEDAARKRRLDEAKARGII